MYWATGSARVLAVEPSLLKLSPDGEDEELELVLPVITSGQGEKQDIEGDSQNGIQSRIVKGTGSGIVDMARNEQGSLWVTITRESIQLWVHRVRLIPFSFQCCRCWSQVNTPITDSLSSIFYSPAYRCYCQSRQNAQVVVGPWSKPTCRVEARLVHVGCGCMSFFFVRRMLRSPL